MRERSKDVTTWSKVCVVMQCIQLVRDGPVEGLATMPAVMIPIRKGDFDADSVREIVIGHDESAVVE